MLSAIDLPPGLHANVAPSVYHAKRIGLVSKGALDVVDQSLAHYLAWVNGKAEEEQSAALAFGSAFHCALLEPARFAAEYVVAPAFGDCRKKENKAARDAWLAEHKGAELLDADDAKRISGMVASVHAHPFAGKMVLDGEPEITVRWNDESTRLPCKARADYYVRRLAMAVDFKTTEDAREKAFTRSVANYAYHVQETLYRSGFSAIGEPLKHFVFVAVEKTPPYAIGIYQLDEAAIVSGFTRARLNMAKLAEAVSSGNFPGYAAGIQTLSLPKWA
jgi:hypothetical protein